MAKALGGHLEMLLAVDGGGGRVSGQRWGPAGQRDSTAKDLDVRVAGPSGSGISVVWSKAGRDPGGGALWGGESQEVRGRDLEQGSH